MRRILMGLLWFVVLAASLFLLLQIGIAAYILATSPKGMDQGALVKAASDFTDAHSGNIRNLDALTFVAAVLLAGFGTLRGSLPGTRRRN